MLTACAVRDSVAIEELLKMGRLQATDTFGNSALVYSALIGDDLAVSKLLQQGRQRLNRESYHRALRMASIAGHSSTFTQLYEALVNRVAGIDIGWVSHVKKCNRPIIHRSRCFIFRIASCTLM